MEITEMYYFIHHEFDTNGRRESNNISFNLSSINKRLLIGHHLWYCT